VTLVHDLEDAPAPSSDAVDAERDRRIGLPLPVSLSGGRSFSINTDDNSLRNINGLATGAVLAKITSSTTPTPFIASDNSIVSLSPDDLISVGLQVQTQISKLTFAGRALKNMSPIPADYATNDSYWV